ncbi:MAG: hypothetical protein GF331_26865 [Chitinivibrionales bacterium]|nr:hypothetical protein [Chitinivibrionales bacterium]
MNAPHQRIVQPADPHELAAQVKRIAAECGYVACGITSTEPFDDYIRALEDRCRRFPESRALYDNLRPRADPTRTAPWARSIIVGIRWYGKYVLPRPFPRGIGRNYLFDRRNPACPDHARHRDMRENLRALGMRVKAGGVPERAAAVRAGVAQIGKNGFAYAGRYGSWVNIESWRVDAILPPDPPTTQSPCPPGCRACLDGCPTNALEAPGCMRINRCVAYLTYEAPGPIAASLWQSMGCWIYGCDRCQEICPLNRNAWQEREPAPWLAPLLPLLSAERLATMDETTYREKIHPAFWYIPPEDLARWHHNARRACEASDNDAEAQAGCAE